MAQQRDNEKAKPGDLIEIFNGGLYQHWAIYVGNGFVVHLCPLSEGSVSTSSSSKSVSANKAFVKKEKLQEVVGTDKWKINNILDDKCTPRQVQVIVQDAERSVGKERPYSVTTENCEHFVTLLRYGQPESQQVDQVSGNRLSLAENKMPKPGDLIEIFRGHYQHWAIYVGDGFVVHLCPPSEGTGSTSSSSKSVLANKAFVKKEKLQEVVGTDKWKINNIRDDKYIPRPVEVIVQQAKDSVGNELPYSVTSSNCEHFVTLLRYGRPESQQATNGLIAAVLLILGVGAVAYIVYRSNKKEKNTQ
ncbi:hypothetical protein WMY93_029041 [Mugilogobius chulae]|uniref:LRAT domain-containing protein n=1 Tax=Mugilogobius chulae TaxID=88201 RepID=A0AAW0MUQ2_9GOBI